MNGQLLPWDNPKNYKRTCKKRYEITAEMPLEGTRVYNKFEQANYVTNSEKQFVLTGTAGEQWVIDVNKLAKTYTLADGRPITKDILSRMVVGTTNEFGLRVPVIKPFKIATTRGPINWAIHIPINYVFQIPTSWGDILTVNAPNINHGHGDYIVCSDIYGCPNLNDRWVVNGNIFPDTYDMRAFPGLSTTRGRK